LEIHAKHVSAAMARGWLPAAPSMPPKPLNRPIRVIDVEASGGRPECYPLEIGWAAPGDAAASSLLIRPEPSWGTGPQQWQRHAEAVHGISHETASRDGTSALSAAVAVNNALVGCDVFSDDPLQDQRWIDILFKEVGLRRSFQVFPLAILHQRLGATGDSIAVAKEKARAAAPIVHRAGPDAMHKAVYVKDLLRIHGKPSHRVDPPYRPHEDLLRAMEPDARRDPGVRAVWMDAVHREKAAADRGWWPRSEKMAFDGLLSCLKTFRKAKAQSAREHAMRAGQKNPDSPDDEKRS
jgi:hypothetical protein